MEEKIIVNIKQGKLCGKISTALNGEEFISFQGIPYAKPPLGELRFKSPRLPEPWDGIKDATKEGSDCYARHILTDEIVGSEDCLFLNVYTPNLPDKSNSLKPVMVWIHGGGFINGSGSSELYGPDFLIPHDVVVVTINYRIGLFGFMNFEDPSLEIPGNAGLKDQVMALQWVKENIASFNGNPDNVTIFGESAGGASVHYLLLSPMAKGLFHKAILQSGTAINTWAMGKRTTSSIAKVLELDPKNESEIIEKLQKMTSEEIILLQDKLPDVTLHVNERIISPVVETTTKESTFLSKHPFDLTKSGNFNQVPIMIGYCNREGMNIEYVEKCRGGQITFRSNFETTLPYILKLPKGSSKSKELAERIKTLYYGKEEPSRNNLDKSFMLETDCSFLSGIHSTLRYFSATSSVPIYYYRISLESKLNFYKQVMKSTSSGVSHADDLGYLFKTIFTQQFSSNSTESEGIRRFTKLWTNFARNGNPNSVEPDSLQNIEWKPVEKGIYHFADIGENLTVGCNPENTRMKLWDEIYDMIPTANV